MVSNSSIAGEKSARIFSCMVMILLSMIFVIVAILFAKFSCFLSISSVFVSTILNASSNNVLSIVKTDVKKSVGKIFFNFSNSLTPFTSKVSFNLFMFNFAIWLTISFILEFISIPKSRRKTSSVRSKPFKLFFKFKISFPDVCNMFSKYLTVLNS